MRKMKWAHAFLAGTLMMGSCATRQPGDPVTPGYNTYSPQQDIELGRQAAQEVRQQVDIVQNPELQSYVSNLGKKLAAQPQAGDYPYEFTLINDDNINAFALPGGPIFINSGILDKADNEAQVAGVMAHEISHVALRHSTSQASKANIIQIPAVLAGIALGNDSVLGQLGQVGLGLGVNSLIMKYSRSAESEADALGARIMSGAGYDPVEMARFFQKLEAQGGSGGPAFLASHPAPGDRVKNVQAEVATFAPNQQYNAGTGQLPKIKQIVAQLPPPKQPKGQVANAAAAAPSGAMPTSYQSLQTDRVAVAYPSGWKAYGGGNASTITIAPQQGLVRTGNGVSIGYGVVMSYYRPQSARANLSSATSELIAQLQQTNRNLRVAGNARQVRVNGSNGIVTQLSGASPYGGQERDVVLTVARPEGLFYMIFVAPSNNFEQVQGAFQKMLDSIQFRG